MNGKIATESTHSRHALKPKQVWEGPGVEVRFLRLLDQTSELQCAQIGPPEKTIVAPVLLFLDSTGMDVLEQAKT